MPCPSPGDLPHPGIKATSAALVGGFFTSEPAAAAAKSLQSCPTLCDPIEGSPPGSPVPGILQARTLEWAAICFSNALKCKVKGKSLSRVRLFETPWTAAYQAPPSMGFSRQGYFSGVPSLSPTEPAGKPNNHWIVFLKSVKVIVKKERKKEGGGKKGKAEKKVTKDQRFHRLDTLQRQITKLIKKSKLDPRLEKGLNRSSGTTDKIQIWSIITTTSVLIS